jgi:hypothetical protein
MHSAETITDSAQGTYISFWTTPIGSTGMAACAERMRLAPDGTITANGQAIVDTSGNLASANGASGSGTTVTVVNGIVTAVS